jgi:predicted nuclease of predicted toxin-antitoxin system
MKSNQEEWFQVSEHDWLPKGFKGKKLKLLLDENIPTVVANEIRSKKICAKSLPGELRGHSDNNILQFSEKNNLVLLTTDQDFWDDKKFPLNQLKTGIIILFEPVQKHNLLLRSFGLVYGCFAKNYPLNWWNKMKIKAILGEFEVKIFSFENIVVKYRLRLKKGYLEAKEI